MAIYDLYGVLSDDIEAAQKILETALNIQFEIRNSDYQGGDYFQWGKADNEHFVLKRNIDPFDGQPAEMSFPVYKVLFYVNDTARSADLQEKMNNGAKDFSLLRHENIA